MPTEVTIIATGLIARRFVRAINAGARRCIILKVVGTRIVSADDSSPLLHARPPVSRASNKGTAVEGTPRHARGDDAPSFFVTITPSHRERSSSPMVE
ncbi:hypothetical protein BDZ89DRAFT_1130632 [Hymenopellis radicata]|nr:hypothetical protein BDZ89DRAFT_1130632 [Hymenopellis radicata]